MNEFVQVFPENWQKNYENKGFITPSLIQQAVFQPLSNKQSIVAISPTGSGKTLAYLWPLLLNVEPGEASALVIFASSQELAIQVADVAREWGKDKELKVQSLVGGANVKRQIEGLKKKPEILIGTPGRILELMKAKKIKAHQVKTMVFDEADQLFDAGNSQIIDQILHQAPTEYQLAFFSATADRSLESIEKITGKTFETIDVTAEDDSRKSLRHYFLRVPIRKKDEYLRRLTHIEDFQGLIFFNQLTELGVMEEKLLYRGVPVGSLASDQNKLLRKAALEQFKKKKISALLTTDVAARGLDITGLPYVVNAEVPLSEEAYLHRSGRTGRMGNEGTVITLVQDNNLRDLKRLLRPTNITLEEIFLHGGKLQTDQPIKEDVATAANNKYKKSFPGKEQNPEHNKNKSRKKVKNKSKKERNKGARRK
ncbi:MULTISPECIES: DEAD/DEAH box helicase [Enterococcus]|uniref:DEAD/DEAH box helicase n=1 Tax=Enterococcus TaxID=1350 RepID=UPI001C5A8ABC|nr:MULTISPECIES: DEAD/DEAH box helicase [Enterococcus]QXX71242.1 DEAD/DEAH box helicase [Enterococcus lactis]WLE21354.1 DEAD/DEAH box helicase [Enterococcus faecium]